MLRVVWLLSSPLLDCTTPVSDVKAMAHLLPLVEFFLGSGNLRNGFYGRLFGVYEYVYERPLSITPTHIYIYTRGVKQRTTLGGVIFSGRKMTYL